MPDQNIFDRILGGEDTVLDDIYKRYRERFISWVREKYDCSGDLAVELYQTVVLIFYNEVASGKRGGNSGNFLSQLCAIADDRWVEFNQYKLSQQTTNDLNHLQLILDRYGSSQSQEIRLLYQAIIQLGDPHRKMLEAIYAFPLDHDNEYPPLGSEVDYTLRAKRFQSIQQLIRILAKD